MHKLKNIFLPFVLLTLFFSIELEAQEKPEPDIEIIKDVYLGEEQDLYYAFRNVKFNLGDNKKIQAEIYVARNLKTYLVVRYLEHEKPIIEFRYQNIDDMLVIDEVSVFNYKTDFDYIKKVYDGYSGNLLRIIVRDIDDSGEEYEVIIREEAGKNKRKNIVLQSRSGNLPIEKKIIKENWKLFRMYPEENLKVEKNGEMYSYLVNGEKISVSFKINQATNAGGFSIFLGLPQQQVRLYLDYKINTLEEVKYPTIKLVTTSSNNGLETVSKSFYEYNKVIEQYELSNLDIKEGASDVNDIELSEKYRNKKIVFSSVNKTDVYGNLSLYLFDKLNMSISDFSNMVEMFNRYVVEVKHGELGYDEKVVLFGIEGSGGLYEYCKINSGIDYYYYMVVLYGALSYENGFCQERDISKSVASAFESIGIISVATVANALVPEEIEKFLGVTFTSKSLAKFNNGIIDYGRSIIKK